MRRRTFLSTPALAGLPLEGAGAAGVEIPRRVFGKTGEKLTIVGQAGGRFPLCTPEDARAITRRACELGLNYFDCARSYWDGRSEQVYGEVLAPYRKKIFLTSKSGERTRKGAEADLAKSFAALRTDYLDLWQMHHVGTMEEVQQIFAPGGAIEAFEAAKKAGKCRFIGFTGHADPQVHLAMLKQYDRFDTIFMPLHAADPAWMSFETAVLPLAVERGMGIQCMKSTANAGLLSEIHLRDCLGYALSLPIHCVAVGCTTVGQIEDDVRIAQRFEPLTPARMAELREKAKRLAGPRLETWKRDPNRKTASTCRDGAITA